jgi:hypothetical protein
MATLTRHNPVWFGNTLNATCPLLAGGPEYPHFKETASQVFKKGDLIYLDTNGTIALATINGSNQSDGFLCGVAKKNATGTTGAEIHFHVIRPDDLWVMNVMHGTAALAVTAQTQLGTVRGVRRDTVSSVLAWGVDVENAVEGATDSLARVQIVGFPLKNPFDAGSLTRPAIGDVYGLVIVKFLPFSAASDSVPFQRILQLA